MFLASVTNKLIKKIITRNRNHNIATLSAQLKQWAYWHHFENNHKTYSETVRVPFSLPVTRPWSGTEIFLFHFGFATFILQQKMGSVICLFVLA